MFLMVNLLLTQFWIILKRPCTTCSLLLKCTMRCSVKEGLCNFKQNPWKIPKKKFIFSKPYKWIHSHVFFKDFTKNLSNFVRDFWVDCFRKLKLLLIANMLIYLNTSGNGYIKIHDPWPPVTSGAILFYIE